MDVSVIVPTLAAAIRAEPLMAALECLREQRGTRAVPIVVINGNAYATELLRRLRNDRTIRCIYREEPGIPGAIAAGRSAVDTEYFGVLDDDDLYVRDGLQIKRSALRDDPSLDVIVTNGYGRTAAGDVSLFENFSAAARDPVIALLERNWMTSASGLFRTQSVGPELFAETPKMLEWTYIGLRLSLTRRLKFLDEPTFIINQDTPGSASKSKRYLLGQPEALARMMALGAPPRVQAILRRKLSDAFHDIAARELAEGNLPSAWRSHLASLHSLHGLRYATFTRHLLGALYKGA